MPTPRSKRFVNSPKPDTSKPFALTAAAELDFTAAEGDAKSAPKITINAYNGGLIRVGFFYPYPSIIELTGLKLHSERIPILYDHYSENLVGQSTKIEIGAKSVKLQGIVTGDTEDPESPAGLIVAHARRGFQWQASVGMRPEKWDFIEPNQTAKVNGKNYSGPLYVVRQGSLGEVSFVALGADGSTAARIAASAAKGSIMNKFNEWLTAKGFDPETMSEAQTATLRAAYDAEVKASETPKPTPTPAREASDDTLAKMRATGAEEFARQQSIIKLCGSQNSELAAKAIAEGWTAERAELEVLRAREKVDDKALTDLRASRANVAIHVPKQPEGDAAYQVLEAAACRDLRLPNVERDYKPEVLEAANKLHRPGSMSLQALLIHAAELSGNLRGQRLLSLRSSADIKAALQAGFGVQASGFSTNNISNIVSNVANKAALAAYLAVDQAWRKIARVATATDFKERKSIRLTATNGFVKVGPGGELKHGALSDEALTNQVDTFGQMLGISRQDIINDDLGALADAPRLLGRNGALKLNLEFWAEFMDNSTFFTTARNNYADGAATALSHAALDNAETSFMTQTDPDGNPLGIMPKYLVVPTALSGTADELFISRELRDTTASTKAGTTNRFFNRFEPVKTPYLQNSAITGYSAKKWFLTADPNDLAVIEVAFLNGIETPTVETAEADFNTLGIQMRGYFDFGVNKQEYRAGVARKGEV